MSFLIGLLTVVLVLDCLLLILLVLIQLPKKDAGAGVAFGGGATDALFGAGSGNALTKITKWAAGIFFALAIVLSLMNTHMRKSRNILEIPKNLPAKIAAPAATPAPVAPVVVSNDVAAAVAPVATNVPPVVSTNLPATK